MKKRSSEISRSPVGDSRVPAVRLRGIGGFGKLPVWPDHPDKVTGVSTRGLRRIKFELYDSGFERWVGQWKDWSQEDLIPYDHDLIWQRSDSFVVGVLWAESDIIGRTDYPYVVCAESTIDDASRFLALSVPKLQDIVLECQTARNASGVRDALLRAFKGWSTALPGSPVARTGVQLTGEDRERFLGMSEFGVERIGFYRLFEEAKQRYGAIKSASWPISILTKSAGPEVSSLRVPIGGLPREKSLSLWLEFLDHFLPSSAPRLLLAPRGQPWMDIVVGKPVKEKLGCLRASLVRNSLDTGGTWDPSTSLREEADGLWESILQGVSVASRRQARQKPPSPVREKSPVEIKNPEKFDEAPVLPKKNETTSTFQRFQNLSRRPGLQLAFACLVVLLVGGAGLNIAGFWPSKPKAPKLLTNLSGATILAQATRQFEIHLDAERNQSWHLSVSAATNCRPTLLEQETNWIIRVEAGRAEASASVELRLDVNKPEGIVQQVVFSIITNRPPHLFWKDAPAVAQVGQSVSLRGEVADTTIAPGKKLEAHWRIAKGNSKAADFALKTQILSTAPTEQPIEFTNSILFGVPENVVVEVTVTDGELTNSMRQNIEVRPKPVDVETLLAQGEAALKAMQWRTALTNFNAVLLVQPENEIAAQQVQALTNIPTATIHGRTQLLSGEQVGGEISLTDGPGTSPPWSFRLLSQPRLGKAEVSKAGAWSFSAATNYSGVEHLRVAFTNELAGGEIPMDIVVISNEAPEVHVSLTDEYWEINRQVKLLASVRDETIPEGKNLRVRWQIFGPAGTSVKIGQPESTNTDVLFPIPGKYRIELVASDTLLQTKKQTEIEVIDPNVTQLQALFKAADSAFDQRNFLAAKDSYERILKIDANNGPAKAQLSRIQAPPRINQQEFHLKVESGKEVEIGIRVTDDLERRFEWKVIPPLRGGTMDFREGKWFFRASATSAVTDSFNLVIANEFSSTNARVSVSVEPPTVVGMPVSGNHEDFVTVDYSLLILRVKFGLLAKREDIRESGKVVQPYKKPINKNPTEREQLLSKIKMWRRLQLIPGQSPARNTPQEITDLEKEINESKSAY